MAHMQRLRSDRARREHLLIIQFGRFVSLYKSLILIVFVYFSQEMACV